MISRSNWLSRGGTRRFPAALLGLSILFPFVLPGQTTPASPPTMRLLAGDTFLDFVAADGALAGRYHFRDEFKPHIHPLNSPQGHTITSFRPHDHRHHRALMYALRTPEVNFWEEVSTLESEKVGRQRHLEFTATHDAGADVGFVQQLVWEPVEGGPAVFEETRALTCRRDGPAFLWTWHSRLTSLAATRLTKSQWSRPDASGRKINYHGLGIRFRRDFGGGTRNNGLQIEDGPLHWNTNRTPNDYTAFMGLTPRRVTFVGSIDGIWPVPRVAFTLEQQESFGLFIMDSPITLLSLGPSNIEEMPLAAGQVLESHYSFRVEDLAP